MVSVAATSANSSKESRKPEDCGGETHTAGFPAFPLRSHTDAPMYPLSTAVLAGGEGRRMGRDKAFLPVGGVPCLVRVLTTLIPLSDDLLIITSDEARHASLAAAAAPLVPEARIVTDLFPDTGTLGGIFTAVSSARCPFCLVVGCDMPFLNTDLLRFLVNQVPTYQAVVPQVQGFLQPLHAIYRHASAEIMKADLRASRLKIVDTLKNLRLRIVAESELLPLDPQLLSFCNMNTPEDWRKCDRLAAAKSAR